MPEIFTIHQKPVRQSKTKTFPLLLLQDYIISFAITCSYTDPAAEAQKSSLAFLCYRFVITWPDSEFNLLSSDLVFCAIPFKTCCYKKDNISSPGPYEITNVVPLTLTDINYASQADPVNQTTPPLTTSVHNLWSTC